jgi:type IV secretory pathway TrbD component
VDSSGIESVPLERILDQYRAISLSHSVDGKTKSQRIDGIRMNGGYESMVILLALLLVLIFFGLGFALHILWIVAVVLFVLWLIGLALGRGESAGNHRFFRW